QPSRYQGIAVVHYGFTLANTKAERLRLLQRWGTYWLYRQPKGIARFPGGGTSKALMGTTGFYGYDIVSRKLVRLGVPDPRSAHRDVAYTLFARDGNRLYFGYESGGKMSDPKWSRLEMFVWLLDRHLLERVGGQDKRALFGTYFADSNKFWKCPQRVKSDFMSRNIKGIPLSQWQVPSPLDYCVKPQAGYLDDLVELRGDQAYRNAIIDRLGARLGAQGVGKVLERMDQKRIRLEGYEQSIYDLSSKETRQHLQALVR
ncbi:MAG: hypothetical protein P8Z73_15580, partial [Desulfobacteraceae bacterium]